MYKYNNSRLSPYDPTKLEIHSILRPEDDLIFKLWSECQRDGFFWWRCALHWRGEHRNLCRFSLWYYFLAWISYKNQTDQPRTELNFQILQKTPVHSQNDQLTCFVDEQHSSNTFLNPYNLRDMVPSALISLNHTNDTYSRFNQYPQPTTQHSRADSYPLFSSLRKMDSKSKGLRVSFAFLQRNYFSDGRMNETVAKVEELSDLWEPGAMDATPLLVMNCNCI